MLASISAAIAIALTHLPNGTYDIEQNSEELEYSLEQNQELWSTWCNYYQASCRSGNIFVESVFQRVFEAVTESSDETYESIFQRQIVAFGVNALRQADQKHNLNIDQDIARARIAQFREAVKEDAYKYAEIIQILYLEYYNGEIDAIDVLTAEAHLGISIAEKYLPILLNRPMA
jgi:hypothetical protein